MKEMNARPLALCSMICAAIVWPLAAHDVITTKLTWSRDISRVFARRCVACHGPASSIPLTTYEQVRPWAVDIKEQVLSRAMPPWGAVKGFGDLSPDGALSQEEMLMIAGWVIGGAPEGDPALGPKSLNPEAPKPDPPLRPALEVAGQTRLAHAVTIAGLRPLAAAQSSKITATLPGGDVIPLVWLYRYDPASKITFRFARPISLPPGTEVAASSPVRFALLAK